MKTKILADFQICISVPFLLNLVIIRQIIIIIFFNSLYFDVTIKLFFKVQNIAPINVK